jgi:hypothetical protein
MSFILCIGRMILAFVFGVKPISAPLAFPLIVLSLHSPPIKALSICIHYTLTSTLLYPAYPTTSDLIITVILTVILTVLNEYLIR